MWGVRVNGRGRDTRPTAGSASDPHNHADFIWSVADLLRGDYKPFEYGKVILPLTVLRRAREVKRNRNGDWYRGQHLRVLGTAWGEVFLEDGLKLIRGAGALNPRPSSLFAYVPRRMAT
jgi:hypothetical protein